MKHYKEWLSVCLFSSMKAVVVKVDTAGVEVSYYELLIAQILTTQ